MLIYCNGDSFAAGSGLVDHLYVPDYNEISKTDNTTEYSYKKEELLYKLYNETGRHLWSEIFKIEKTVSWPAKLGKILNATVINNSYGGSSNLAILYRTMIDLAELQRKNTLPDYVLIQISTPGRISIFSDNVYSDSMNKYHLDSLLLQWKHDVEERTQLCKWHILAESNFGNSVRFLMDVSLINSFVYSIIGSYPILLTHKDMRNDFQNVIDKKEPELDRLLEMSRLIDLNPIFNEDRYIENSKILPCGHCSQETVDRFAVALANYINGLEHAKRQ